MIRSHGRITVALAVAALIAVTATAGTGAASPVDPAAPGDQLLPDLRTRPHGELYVQGNDLRLANTIVNTGTGPLQVYPEPTAGGDCDGDGDNDNDRRAFQRVFQDSADPGSPGYFERGIDTASTGHYVGCMSFHPAHNHWHFEDFASYSLWTNSGTLASRSTKVSFCIADGDRTFPGFPGSPRYSYYPVPDGGCTQTSRDGLSIGWSDTYTANTDGQSIDITGLAAGTYCLISRADPNNRLQELKDVNNGRRTPIDLDPAAHTVQVLPGTCRARP